MRAYASKHEAHSTDVLVEDEDIVFGIPEPELNVEPPMAPPYQCTSWRTPSVGAE